MKDDGRLLTHSPCCWQWHIDCAVARIEELREALGFLLVYVDPREFVSDAQWERWAAAERAIMAVRDAV